MTPSPGQVAINIDELRAQVQIKVEKVPVAWNTTAGVLLCAAVACSVITAFAANHRLPTGAAVAVLLVLLGFLCFQLAERSLRGW